MEGGHIVKKFSRSLSFQLMMFVFLDMLVCTAGALLIFYFGKKIIKQWGLCTGMQSGFPACELLLLFSILLMMLLFISIQAVLQENQKVQCSPTEISFQM